MKPLNLSTLSKPFIIAGPCVIENESLVMAIAERLKGYAASYNLDFIFKASFDKANRSSIDSYRGPGLEKGLSILNNVRTQLDLPVTTDIHETYQVSEAAEVVDILQVPAFLCRQTDLLLHAAFTGKILNVKKGQFLSPQEMQNIAAKIESTGNGQYIFTERGTSFGYNNLVVDMRSLAVMKQYAPWICFDATHSVQRPGAQGTASGGDREFVFPLTRAALAVGVDALFFEVHPEPTQALSDGANSLQFSEFERILDYIKRFTRFQQNQPSA